MSTEKIRKDIHLPATVVEKLQVAADKENRTIKNYMEKVLIKHSDKLANGLQQPKN